MKRVLLTLGFWLVAVAAFGQGGRYDSIAWNQAGRPQPGATIAVCNQPATTNVTPCSPLATLFTDSTLTVACTGLNGCANPLTADGLGNFHFYAASGTKFTVQFYGPGITASFLQDQQLTGLTGPVFDTGGQVFNVKALYTPCATPAKGDGVTDDTAAINCAIAAAQGIGTVYLPRGTYKVTGSLTTMLAGTSMVGDSPYTSVISTTATLTPVVGINNSIGYNGSISGVYRDFTVNCDQGAGNGSGRQGIGILQTDSISLTYENVVLRNCSEGLEIRNSQLFSESNTYNNLILANNTAGVMFNWASSPGTNSFAKDKFHISQFNAYATGDAVFKVCPAGVCAGGVPNLYNESIEAFGNFSAAGASYFFDLTGGQQLVEDRIALSAENNGGGTPVVFFSGSNGGTTANQCTSQEACILGVQATIDVPGSINLASPINSFASLMLNSFGTNVYPIFGVKFVGTLTTGGGTSSSITSSQPDIGSAARCWAMPSNGGSLTGVFFSGLASNQVLTMTYPPGAGVTYSVFCI